MPTISDKQELLFARLSAATAIGIAGWFGIHPPAFVAQVVAFAFGLAAASLFPAIFMGIFFKKINKEGAILGMLSGLIFTFAYIVYFQFYSPETNNAAHWLFGISPTGIGAVGAVVNIAVALVVSHFTAPTPKEIEDLIDDIRIPSGAGVAHDH